MNFRVNLAVAFAAAFGFACADKPANLPELEAATQPRPGMQLLGLYAMKVTPVEGSGGKLFAFEPVPVGRDGNPSTNPAGTVQVGGSFGSVVTNAPGCSGVNAITAPVRITNFAVDPLRNVWADIVDMSGNTGNTACNSSSFTLSEGQFFNTDQAQGIWKYNDLAGSTVADGSLAGGTSLPLAGVWAFRYVTLTPFQFYFTVWADNNAPSPTLSLDAGPTQPITWSSPVSASTVLEICAADPGLANQAPCPAGQTVLTTTVAGTGAGPFSFSYLPNGLVANNHYWWRVTNVFAAGTGTFHSTWANFNYVTSVTLPATTPVTFAANDAVNLAFSGFISWTTANTQTDTWVVVCDGTCPATRPAPPPASQLNVKADQSAFDVAPGVLSNYELDVTAMLATDPLSGYYLPTSVTQTYDVRIYNYDGVNVPAFSDPYTAGSITVTPIAALPTITSPVGTALAPVTYGLINDATFTVTWTSDLAIGDTVFELLDLNDPTGTPFYTSPPPPAAGAMVGVPVGGVNTYSVDLKPLLGGLGVGNYTFTVYNNDLAGVWGVTSFFDVVTP